MSQMKRDNFKEEKELERQIYTNLQLPQSNIDSRGASLTHYPRNTVKTTKYTPITFIPKNIFEQFRGLANVYFAFTVVIQAIPGIGTIPVLVAAIPIIFIIVATALKDAFEDYRRHTLDRTLNDSIAWTITSFKNTNYPHPHTPWFHFIFCCFTKRQQKQRKNLNHCTCIKPKHDEELGVCVLCNQNIKKNIFNTFKQKKWKLNRQNRKLSSSCSFSMNGWTQTHWKKLRVGDFVLLKGGDKLPADILVLSTSDSGGICYVETKNLDGETNLKMRDAIKVTTHLNTAEECTLLKMLIETESPYFDLFSQNGTVRVSDEDNLNFNISNVLLRGSVLRNTDFVIGIVLFTGSETKVMLNSGETPSKQSKIDTSMNPIVIINFIILAVLCLLNLTMESILNINWRSVNAPWIYTTNSWIISTLENLGATLVMYQNIVPISLYITVEAMKTIQAYFIGTDIEMYDAETDTWCGPKTWNISDDLGQIDYIFSDKTGTLTENKMDFKKCSIGGKSYGKGYTDVSRFASNDGLTSFDRKELEDNIEADTRVAANQKYLNPFIEKEKLTFIDRSIFADLNANTHQSVSILNFFMLLATCHTVLSPKRVQQDSNKLIYPAQSPDEEALVKVAKDMGVTFIERHNDKIILDVHSHRHEIKILNVLEFNSTRKRMSIIIEKENKEIFILTKGADNVIMERLRPGQESLIRSTLLHLEGYANEGLRTLCLAQRKLDSTYYASWALKFHKANTSLHDREEKVSEVSELIERDLELVGSTAIEDKLQENVPQVIQTLRESGIKIWVLTGDKKETAINIGFACNLFSKDMNMIIIEGIDPDSVHSQIKEVLHNYKDDRGVLALVIDGISLRYAIDYTALGQSDFLKLGILCKSVICCRVSPKQKAQVVNLVKLGTQSMCLAIGDGANDVSMIQEAQIGVGIAGQEGLQAAMSSDYVIAKFKFLQRLLLVHGHWSYYRTGEMILNFFYKNLVWVFVLFWYQLFSGFSANLLYNFSFVMFYNLIFTSLPPVILGIFDQDLTASYLMAYPQLYRSNINKRIFSVRKFIYFLLDAVYQSAVCFFIMYFQEDIILTSPQGYPIDKEYMGTAIAIFGVMTANYYIGFSIKNWTWIVALIVYVSAYSIVAFIPVYNLLLSDSSTNSLFGIEMSLYVDYSFWASVISVVLICILPKMIVSYLQTNFYPTDIDILREEQKMHKIPLKSQTTLEPRLTVHRLSSQKLKGIKMTSMERKNRGYSAPAIMHTGLIDMRTNTILQHLGYAFAHDEDERRNVERILGIDDSEIVLEENELIDRHVESLNRKKSGKVRKISLLND